MLVRLSASRQRSPRQADFHAPTDPLRPCIDAGPPSESLLDRQPPMQPHALNARRASTPPQSSPDSADSLAPGAQPATPGIEPFPPPRRSAPAAGERKTRGTPQTFGGYHQKKSKKHHTHTHEKERKSSAQNTHKHHYRRNKIGAHYHIHTSPTLPPRLTRITLPRTPAHAPTHSTASNNPPAHPLTRPENYSMLGSPAR